MKKQSKKYISITKKSVVSITVIYHATSLTTHETSWKRILAHKVSRELQINSPTLSIGVVSPIE
jgi:hypothetical protein